VVTTLAGTLGLLFAFFGGGGPADRGRSMFDFQHYVGIYLILAAIVLAGAAVFLTLWFLDRRAAAPSRAASPASAGEAQRTSRGRAGADASDASGAPR
jgi:hypothetical protein